MQELSTLINDLGFPTFVCIGFAWYINKRDTQRAEMEKEAKANEIEERKKLIESIELYRVTSSKLLETNKELSETNRLLVNEISSKVNIIENTLLQMNNKM